MASRDYLITIALFFLSIILSKSMFAHESNQDSETKRVNAINVFMSADDFIKREITFVNYVRDQRDAQLAIIRTFRETGGGGTEYTFFFEGLREFKGINDTLKLSAPPAETIENIRRGIVRTIMTGLIRYVSKTPLINHFNISYTEPDSFVEPTDPWNSWVFQAGIHSSLSSEKSYSSFSFYGNLSANRTTETSKTEMSLHYDRDRSRFSFEGGDDYINTNKSFGTSLEHIISLGEHFSAGGFGGFASSDYRNLKARFSLMPGVEYNFFPYSQSTRRQLSIRYLVGYENNNYLDTTIYEKIKEGLFSQRLTMAFSLVERWGSVSLNGSYRNYLHDFSKRNLSVSGRLNLRVVKGLSLSLGGRVSVIHDQLSLRKGNLTLEEMLLRRTELATQYRFNTSIGISYTFGSIFNNVVNPRFGSTFNFH